MQKLLQGILCFYLVLLCASLGMAQDYQPPDGRIVGGRNASISDYPWQVALMDSSSTIFLCGGSILSERWVLTAAHCLGRSSMTVRAGVSQRNDSSGQDIPVQSQISHPQYDPNTDDYDIALLYLSAPLDLTGPTARAIPPMTTTLAASGLENPGVMAIITGWGDTTEGGSMPITLQVANVPVVSNTEANLSYGSGAITPRMLAAGYEAGGVDACQGDSGGPLAVPYGASPVGYVLAGVTSWGRGCARADYPGIYTRVSAFQDWIEAQMGISSETILQPGIPLENLAGETDSQRYFAISVPTGARDLLIRSYGGSGDVDLYVRHGTPPTQDDYDCRPFLDGNDESCTAATPEVGTHYIMLRAFASYSGVSLVGSYTPAPRITPLFADGFENP